MAKEFYQGVGEYTTWPNGVPDAMGLTYDDVYIAPGLSSVASREDVDTSVQVGPYTLTVPVIAAPMDTASGDIMIRKLAELGALGSLPRAESDEAFQFNLGLAESYAEANIPCVYAVGMGRDGFSQAEQLKERGAEIVLLDVANGGQMQAIELAKRIKGETGLTIMAGNIATYRQAEAYNDAEIDLQRVGIGGGSVCITRDVTGIGVPQLSAVLDTAAAGGFVVADGGLRNSGDIAKALSVAPVVMVGSMIAGTDEAPGEVMQLEGGRQVKLYRGQASKEYMVKAGRPVTASRAPEGVSAHVDYKGPVEDVIKGITGGLRSSMSYVGATTLADFREKSAFVRVSAAGRAEGHPHALR